MKALLQTMTLAISSVGLFFTAFAVHAESQECKQPPAKILNKAASIIKGEAVFEPGMLIVKVTTEEEPDASWFQVFLDTDYTTTTGRRHLEAGEEGADFLMEGSSLYYWYGGGDQKGWHWKPVDELNTIQVKKESGNTVGIYIPLEKVGLKAKDKVRIVVEIKTPKWTQTEDTLPRSGGWTVVVP